MNNHEAKIKRARRVRKGVKASNRFPRLTVFRSHKHIYAQIIDDASAKTLASASTVTKDIGVSKTSDIQAASAVGKLIARRALDAKIENVCFDRGCYLYHGRVKALADAAREEGLKF